MIGTQIELEEKLQVLELARHSFTKLIRIYVKECEIGEESKLLRELPSDVTMIEIDSRNGANRVVVEHCSAKKFGVVTHIRYDPIFGERSVAVVGDEFSNHKILVAFSLQNWSNSLISKNLTSAATTLMVLSLQNGVPCH